MNDLLLKNLILIQHLFGAGSKRAFNVMQKLSDNGLLDKDFAFTANNTNLQNSIRLILASSDYSVADNIIKMCNESDIKIITYSDDIYPESLRNIDAPPIVLYYRGTFPDFNNLPSVTIVGPRKATDFGIKSAYSLGFRFAKSGMIVVSGGARGCDFAAHNGCFKGEGVTCLVLGCGIDNDYLPENKPLRDTAQNNGCILSEYPPKTPATRFSFPIRNRIMAGLSQATVVVEAGIKSGSLITARNAIDYGREVFVIPGNPTDKNYKGSNALLRDGAKPLLDAGDVFNEYILKFPSKIDINRAYEPPKKDVTENNTEKNKKISQETLSKEAKMVYNYLDRQIFGFDDLSELELSTDELLSALTELELEGLISAIPGGKYKVI